MSSKVNELTSDDLIRANNLKSHDKMWWEVKVLCGFLLIGGLFDQYLGSNYLNSTTLSPVLIPQMIVVVGVVLNFWHYYILKSSNKNISTPNHLVKEDGLFKFIRHPMYFSEMIYYLGLVLMSFSVWSLLVLMTSYYALIKQAEVEDSYLAARFKSQYPNWWLKRSTLIPFIY